MININTANAIGRHNQVYKCNKNICTLFSPEEMEWSNATHITFIKHTKRFRKLSPQHFAILLYINWWAPTKLVRYLHWPHLRRFVVKSTITDGSQHIFNEHRNVSVRTCCNLICNIALNGVVRATQWQSSANITIN